MAELDTSKINEILNYYGLKTNIEETKKWVKQYVGDALTGITLDEYYTKEETDGLLEDKQGIITDLPEIRSGATLGATALQSFTETDPTVPAWAKESTKPTYTAAEVGALSSATTIPTKTSDLVNDSGFLTSHQELKTINNESIVGTGDITIVASQTIKTINNQSLAGSGNLSVGEIPVIDMSLDTGTTFAIEPNKMYMFGVKETLTITDLISGRTDIVNEYMFQFTSGSVATTLSVPNTVVWLKEPDVQTGKKYMVSIENNLGIIGEWSNE